MDSPRKHSDRVYGWYALGIAIGLGLGIVIGAALGSIGVGIAVGSGLGVAFGIAFSEADKRKRPDPTDRSGGAATGDPQP